MHLIGTNQKKMLRPLCWAALCVLAAVCTNAEQDLKISLATLKSDLDLILDDTTSPRTINIQYTDSGVLQLLMFPKLEALGGRFIQISGEVEIKQRGVPIQKMRDLDYKDGSFGALPPEAYHTTYIIIKEMPKVKIEPAEKTLRYISKEQLTTSLSKAIADYPKQNPKAGVMFEWKDFVLHDGASPIEMYYNKRDDNLVLVKPLKGISVRRNEINFNKDFFREKKERLEAGVGLNDRKIFSIHATKKKPEIFFDIWFERKTKKFGSSQGSFDGYDAFRVYDEWSHDVSAAKMVEMEAKLVPSRANYIRERTFDEDILRIYTQLRDHDIHKNAILNYADDIVLELHANGEGNNQRVFGTGTTEADATGSGPENVKTFYDLKKLEYSDEENSEKRFKPTAYERKTFNLKYIDWNKFEKHLSAIWAALQGGCARGKNLVYDFNIFYGKNVPIKYNCKTQTIQVAKEIKVVTHESKYQKSTLTEITDIRYVPSRQTIVPQITEGLQPIAIRQEPADLWAEYDEPGSISSEALRSDLEQLRETLIKIAKSKRYNKNHGIGVIVLDDKVLYEMEHPNSDASYRYTEVQANFMPSLKPFEKKLNFAGSAFSRGLGDTIPLSEVLISTNYKPFDDQMAKSLVVGSKYLTVKQLQVYLKKVANEASDRCASRTSKNTYFQLVQHNKFALQGFYQCSEEAFFVKGNFKVLLFTNTKIETQVQTSRLVDNFIYLNDEEFFVPNTDSFRDVFAISIPEVPNLVATQNQFGAPLYVDRDTVIMFKTEAFQ